VTKTKAAPEPLATTEEVAAYLQKPVKTLAQWRSRGIGPKYSKPGGHDVRYDWADVREWVTGQQPASATA
jgi:predicted DNA-binding transcriptional regulator AlpA